MYRTSDIGEGYNYTKFAIHTNSKEVFFTSKNINQQPCDLLSNVFDSIHISINNENQHVIKFSKDAVIGCPENIFTQNSIWEYDIIDDQNETQFAKNPLEVHQFTFEVSEEILSLLYGNSRDISLIKSIIGNKEISTLTQ